MYPEDNERGTCLCNANKLNVATVLTKHNVTRVVRWQTDKMLDRKTDIKRQTD